MSMQVQSLCSREVDGRKLLKEGRLHFTQPIRAHSQKEQESL